MGEERGLVFRIEGEGQDVPCVEIFSIRGGDVEGLHLVF